MLLIISPEIVNHFIDNPYQFPCGESPESAILRTCYTWGIPLRKLAYGKVIYDPKASIWTCTAVYYYF